MAIHDHSKFSRPAATLYPQGIEWHQSSPGISCLPFLSHCITEAAWHCQFPVQRGRMDTLLLREHMIVVALNRDLDDWKQETVSWLRLGSLPGPEKSTARPPPISMTLLWAESSWWKSSPYCTGLLGRATVKRQDSYCNNAVRIKKRKEKVCHRFITN